MGKKKNAKAMAAESVADSLLLIIYLAERFDEESFDDIKDIEEVAREALGQCRVLFSEGLDSPEKQALWGGLHKIWSRAELARTRPEPEPETVTQYISEIAEITLRFLDDNWVEIISSS